MAEEIIQNIISSQADKVKITVEKGQKNTYAWEIRCYGDNIGEVIEQLISADTMLRKGFVPEP